MNNSQIDVLLQLPVSRPEPPATSARTRDDGPAFGNHFRRASDAGSTPPPQPSAPPAQRPANSTPSDAPRSSAQQRRPELSDRAPESADEHHSKRPAESETPAAAAVVSEDDASGGDRDQDCDDTEREQSTEVAAVLLAAEQLVKTAGAETAPADEVLPADQPVVEVSAKPIQKQSGGKKDGPKSPASSTAPAGSARTAKSTAVELPPRGAHLPVDHATDVELPPADKATSAADASAALIDEVVQPGDASAASTEVSKNSSVKRTSQGSEHEIVPGHDVGKDPSSGKAAPAAPKSAQAAASASASLKPSANAAAKATDKKSTARTSATTSDVAQPPTERSVAPIRAADAPAAAPASTLQTQVPAAANATVNAAANTGGAKETPTAKPGPLSPFARLERATHATRESHRANQSESNRHIDPARFVSRVARAVQTAQERGGPLQLRLSPPELGAMRLELSVNQGALTATIETDNQTARQLLLDNLPALRDRLAEQNVKIERFDVDVRRDSTGSQQNPASHDRGTHEHSNERSGGTNPTRRDNAIPSNDDAPPVRRTITTTSINVVA